MKLRSVSLLAVTALVAAVIPTLAAERRNSRSLIVTEKGRVGDFAVGDSIERYQAYVTEEASQRYRSHDGLFVFNTDEQRLIQSIEATGRTVFTERFIRPDDSTLKDVLRSYGTPRKTEMQDGNLMLKYGSAHFVFQPSAEPAGVPGAYQRFLQSKLKTVVVTSGEVVLEPQG